MMNCAVLPMSQDDIPGVTGLQRLCFPEPFPQELLWSAEHLETHLRSFPEGQFVAKNEADEVVASSSATLIGEDRYQAHCCWNETVGGPFLHHFDPNGSTLYGLDISVHPACRNLGIARLLYEERFALVRKLGLTRYATGCRMPNFAAWSRAYERNAKRYIEQVARGFVFDPTLTPLLKLGLTPICPIERYMDDDDSLNCACLLEWKP